MDSMDIDLDFEVPDVQDLPDAAEGDLDLNFVATASQVKKSSALLLPVF